jgi:ribonuclease HII
LRDNYMADLSLKHPNYGFENHVGYGTKMHKLALEKSGIINGVHRASFKPVQALLQSQ